MKSKDLFVYEIIAITIFLILGALLRYQGFKNGGRYTFDECLYPSMAHEMSYDINHYNSINYTTQSLKKRPNRHIPDYLWKKVFKHPPMFCYMILASFKIHGKNNKDFLGQSVKVSVLMGVLAILLVYLIGRMVFNPQVGILAAFFLLIDPVHWICSQKIWMETTVTFFCVLAPLFYLYALKREKSEVVFYILTGLAAGGAVLTKYTGGLAFASIFLYTLIFCPKRLLSPKWMLIPLCMFFVLIPWIKLNFDAYGFDFIFAGKKGFEDMKHGQKVLGRFLPVLCTGGFFITIYYLFKKKILDYKKITNRLPVFAKNKYVWMAVLWILIIVGIGREWTKIMQALSLTYEPPTSWRGRFFETEPWYFYLKKLFEYFPVYIWAYLSPFFINFKNRNFESMVLINAVLTAMFFIFWGNFQSRYILPAIPWFLILSAFGIFFVHDKISTIDNKNKRNVLYVLLWCFVAYGIAKAIQVDVLLAWTNKPCYF